MSLWENCMEPCVLYTHTTARDGQGGSRKSWTKGATFSAALVPISDNEAKKADKQQNERRYRVYTHKRTTLHYGDVFKRGSQAYRVVTDDNATPLGAILDMRVVEAEQCEMEGEQR